MYVCVIKIYLIDIYIYTNKCVGVRVWTWTCCHFRISTDSTGYACALYSCSHRHGGGHDLLGMFLLCGNPTHHPWHRHGPEMRQKSSKKSRFFNGTKYMLSENDGIITLSGFFFFFSYHLMAIIGGISHFQTHLMHWTNPLTHSPKRKKLKARADECLAVLQPSNSGAQPTRGTVVATDFWVRHHVSHSPHSPPVM